MLPQLAAFPARDIVLVFANGSRGEPHALTDERVVVAIAPAGRARQLNAGAHATDSDWLWFLHADSQLDARVIEEVIAALGQDEDMLAYFGLRFLPDGPRWMALNAIGARLRSRWLGLPFGDQGFLLPRRVFEALGGFDEGLDGGEDHALVWRARRQGIELRELRADIHTSARKYAERGWWRTTREHLALTWRQARRFAREGQPS